MTLQKTPVINTKPLTDVQVILLVFLLIFVLPAGILYALWLLAGRKGLLCGCGCMMLPGLLLLIFIWAANHSCTGERVPAVDWLKDKNATEISYYHSYIFTAYEYKTTEEDFRKYANSTWKFKEITEPVTVPRYLYMTKYKGNLSGGTRAGSQAVIKNGIVAQERWKNGGGYIAAYDRDTGKAYIQKNPH